MLPIDLTNDFDPKAARESLADGGVLPVGKYHARLTGAKDKAAGGTSLSELTFEVVGGLHAGSEIKAALWHSTKTAANGNRQKLVMSALGMIVRGPGGKGWVMVEGLESFADALGTECVVEVEHRSYVGKSGKEAFEPVATFNGFWHLDDPDTKSVAKAPKKPTPPPRKTAVNASDI